MKTLITIALLTTCLFTANAQDFGNQQKLNCITISNGNDLNSIGSEGSGVTKVDEEGSGVTKVDEEGSGVTKTESDGTRVQTYCQFNKI